jgi:SAM-dependent methyltransferase
MPLLSKFLTRARLSRITRYLGRHILDAGCGYGELLDYLPAGVERIILLDRSPARQERLTSKLAHSKLQAEFWLVDLEQSGLHLNFAACDTVVMAALLEHLKYPDLVLKNIRPVMNADARLILTTPSPLGGKLHWLGSHLGLVYAEAAREHSRFYDFAALQLLLKRNGFLVRSYERFLFGLNQLVVAEKERNDIPP